MKKIDLVKDTIDSDDIQKLISWLQTNPRLTKGELTVQFEKEWSEWLGKKYSVFVNSGYSANLAAIYGLLLSGKLKNNKIVVPAVSWVTTVTPAVQFGMEPIMCECDEENLGLNINHLKQIIEEHNPSCIILVHVLGFPNHMDEILELCEKHNIYKQSVPSHGYMENVTNFKGIVCKSNFSSIYTDINPSFNFRIFFNNAKETNNRI